MADSTNEISTNELPTNELRNSFFSASSALRAQAPARAKSRQKSGKDRQAKSGKICSAQKLIICSQEYTKDSRREFPPLESGNIEQKSGKIGQNLKPSCKNLIKSDKDQPNIRQIWQYRANESGLKIWSVSAGACPPVPSHHTRLRAPSSRMHRANTSVCRGLRPLLGEMLSREMSPQWQKYVICGILQQNLNLLNSELLQRFHVAIILTSQ